VCFHLEKEHCLDVHEGELSIEEGKEDNLEGAEIAFETKAYLDTRKHNIKHLQVVVEKFEVLAFVQEL
jgi:hypothetical protein